MKWLKRTFLVLFVLLAVLALVPFFVRVDDYVPLLEKELSARLDQPVSIDGVQASLFPLPHAVLEGITIGDADDVKVRKVTLRPDLWSLLGDPKVIRSIDFEDLLLSQKALGAMVTLTRGERGAGAIRVEAVKLRTAMVKLERGSFGPFDADVRVSRAGAPGEFTLVMQDRALTARVAPQGERLGIEISARNWTLPLGPALRFEKLEITGIATTRDADLNDVTAKIYGGDVTGKIAIGWDKGVTLKGELVMNGVELRDAVALVSPTTRVSGKIDAKPVFSASAPKASELDEALRLETPFTVHDGVLHGFDLLRAAAAFVKPGGTAGQTRFDELAGHLVAERRTYRFSKLRVAAGGLSARGHVAVAPSRALSGQLSASVKAAGAAAAVPLTVAGTLESPLLYPNTKALLGAAAGTAVLGPGLGTAAGAKLGEIAEELLRRKR